MRIFIGGESQVVPFEELSVVSAPYEVDGQVVGTLGVIGPTRMAYDQHDSDCGHHLQPGQQRAEPPDASPVLESPVLPSTMQALLGP